MISFGLMCAIVMIKVAAVSTQQENVLAMFPEFKALMDTVKENTQNIALNMKNVDAVSKNVAANTKDVADLESIRPHFLAFLSNSRAVSGYTIIKFEEVMTNIGNGYNKDTGFFTAPEDGVYIFGCVLVAIDGYNFHYNIYKNNNLFTIGFVSHTPRPNSNTQHVVLDLKKGDNVSIRHRYDVSEQLHGSRHSYFFGYQLQ